MIDRRTCTGLAVAALSAACGGVGQDSYETDPSPPATPGASWLQVEDPATRGWDVEGLERVRREASRIGTTALLVIDDGRLVLSFGASQARWYVASQRKSILSAMFGAYVESGVIDLQATLDELGIDDIDPPLTDDQKQATVEHLLTSSSGICHDAAAAGDDGCVPGSAPGERFGYNNFDFNVLGTIFREQTGEDIFANFAERFAGPLQMEDFDPVRDGRYQYEEVSRHPAYVFDMSARDLARFGLMMLRQGRWNHAEVVSESWIEESTRAQIETDTCLDDLCAEYGYMWWRHAPEIWTRFGLAAPARSFSAVGSFVQRVEVFVDRDLVIVHRAHPVFGRLRPVPGRRDYRELIAAILRAQGSW